MKPSHSSGFIALLGIILIAVILVGGLVYYYARIDIGGNDPVRVTTGRLLKHFEHQKQPSVSATTTITVKAVTK